VVGNYLAEQHPNGVRLAVSAADGFEHVEPTRLRRRLAAPSGQDVPVTPETADRGR
jgi:hypothetical protein